MESALTVALRALSLLVLVAGLYVTAGGIAASGEYPGQARVGAYRRYLERTTRLLFLRTRPEVLLRGQVAAIGVGLTALVMTREPLALLLVAAGAVGPFLYLEGERRARVRAFDENADGFILSLANSLKAVPNIGAALEGILPVLRGPMRQEVLVVLNEVRVGSTVDQALLGASTRIRSGSFDAAVSALLVGRQVGGNLPLILERTAETIREMNRLQGVVRTKTSESRAQLAVLACFPAGMVALFEAASPGYFAPLEHTLTGRFIAGIAAVLWATSIVLARQLTRVDV